MTGKASAAVLTAVNLPFETREYPVVAPPAGHARLKLAASGICGTDIHIQTGKLGPFANQIIGHEFVGVVDAVAPEGAVAPDGAARGFKVGDNALVCIARPCGKCALCESGDDANCVNMGVTNSGDPSAAPHFHGGFGEYSFAPFENLVKLPAGADPLAAAVFACPGPTVLHAFSLAEKAGVDIRRVRTAVVQGVGPVGCFAILYLASLGVGNIIAVGGARSRAREGTIRRLGATGFCCVPENTDGEITGKVREISDGLGADLVFEASGKPAALPLGFALLRNRGVYLVPGQYSDSGGVEIQPQTITFKALHIIGSSQYSIPDVVAYLDFLERNPDLRDVIKSLATCYTVPEINRAFDDAKAGKNIKSVLVWGGGGRGRPPSNDGNRRGAYRTL